MSAQGMSTEPASSPDMSTQEEHLDRVKSKIQRRITLFCKERKQHTDGTGGEGAFHMVELVAFVLRAEPSTAPDSVSRILRELRRRGSIRYVLVSRRNSFYRVM